MKIRWQLNIFILIVVCFCGCSSQSNNRCVPVLFPYPEYDYRADFQKLVENTAAINNHTRINLYHLNIPLPNGWKYTENVFPETTKFFSSSQELILSYRHARDFKEIISKEALIGCGNFELNPDDKKKTMKDFYSDLYMLTRDSLPLEPGFWHYYILWEKTRSFDDAAESIHYKGKNLEAFLKNIDPQKRGKMKARTTIMIFPEKIAPDHLALTATFSNNAFFYDFLSLLSILNP